MGRKKFNKAARAFLLLSMFSVAIILTVISVNNHRDKRLTENYPIPDVTLIDQDGSPVSLVEFLDCDKPIILEFIYTACTTVCPTMMVKLANLQRRLEPDTEQARLISISIDPEKDTPEILRGYRNRYQAKPGWAFLTGSQEDINKVMAAFKTRPTDMSTLDSPILLRLPKMDFWIRLTGKVDMQTLWNEYTSSKNN